MLTDILKFIYFDVLAYAPSWWLMFGVAVYFCCKQPKDPSKLSLAERFSNWLDEPEDDITHAAVRSYNRTQRPNP